MRIMWSKINGVDEDCEVSNTGQVRYVTFKPTGICETLTDVVREPTVLKDGSLQMRFHVGGQPVGKSIHKIVAQTFCENPHGFSFLEFLDDNRGNAECTNLRWVKSLQDHGLSKIDDSTKHEIKERLAAGEQAYLIAEEFGLSRSMVTRIKNGTRWN